MVQPPRLLLCGFEVVPSGSAVARRLTEMTQALVGRAEVVLVTVKATGQPHIERFHGARLMRVPVGDGPLAARVETFRRAVQRQLASEEYVAVHVTDPASGLVLCQHKAKLGYRLVYDRAAQPEALAALSSQAADQALLRQDEALCVARADQVLNGTENLTALALYAPLLQPAGTVPPARSFTVTQPAVLPVAGPPTSNPAEGWTDPAIAALLDPWFCQIAHGYCPPKAKTFSRPPPPTTFPGRDK